MGTSQGRHRALLAHGAALVFAWFLIIPFAGSAYGQSVSLAWDANTETNLAGYRVYRSEQSGSYGSAVNGTLLTTPSFTDGTVQYGHTYYYAVTAVDTTGNQSGYSNQVQAVVGSTFVSNQPPTVTAGPNQTITLGQTATVTASATDDGLPNGVLTYTWSVVSGGSATFSAPHSATTTVSFSASGGYTLRVTVSDGQLSASADVQITVSSANQAPKVSAGPSQTITLGQTATVTASATDDGLPNGVLTYKWTVVSGSGVTFSSPNSATTSVSFSASGGYTLRATASDGQLSASADVNITVVDSSLTIYVSKNGNVLKGALTSINESTSDSRAKKLDLFIDDLLASSVNGTSLNYKWDIRKLSGTHVVKGQAYDSTSTVLESNTVTVVVK